MIFHRRKKKFDWIEIGRVQWKELAVHASVEYQLSDFCKQNKQKFTELQSIPKSMGAYECDSCP